ncbi:hypothetical protein [Jannaschia sp. M317]|uniref:hypothetical protein n=1 Tax=Jannaschia sp. M317 TaxID=2867011 RepID=UPI0021A391FD|nr:hypothetical protein [Jannaschia sp. M317]UWQ17838.1 hypothetical protein K3551_00520 [Jannaschia sp. M317]
MPQTTFARTALTALIILQGVMLTALYAGVPPHPPEATPLFGMAPYLGASIAIAVGALMQGPLATRTGRVLTAIAALAALVSYGPHKYLDAAIGGIWPSVVVGQLAAFALLALLVKTRAATA